LARDVEKILIYGFEGALKISLEGFQDCEIKTLEYRMFVPQDQLIGK